MITEKLNEVKSYNTRTYKKMKGVYFVKDFDGEFGVFIIANNSKDAKRRVYKHDIFEDSEYIDLRVKKLHGVKKECLDKFEVGHELNEIEYLSIFPDKGLIGCCPICENDEVTIVNISGVIGCWDCIEKN